MATEKRLIDANELMDDNVWLCGGFVGDPYCDGYMEALDKVETVIREFPTVDAVEVVHGHWFWKPLSENSWVLTCSVCESMKGSAEEYNYCPHCGADMRERKDDEIKR